MGIGRRAGALLATVTVIVTLAWLRPGGCEGRPDATVPLGPRDDVRVATYNIHHGEGPTGERDLEQVIATLRALDADILGLQEVDRRFGERSHWADQPERIAEALGMHVVFAADVVRPTPGRPTPGEYGNAVLSRFLIEQARHVVLPSPLDGEQRSAVEATVEVAGRRLQVYSTHFSASSHQARVAQALALRKHLSGQPGLPVVLGDLNAGPTDEPVQILDDALTDAWAATRGPGTGTGCTFATLDLEDRIDYVLVGDQVDVAAADVVWSRASGHLPVVAGLRW